MSKKRKQHSAGWKAKVALAAVKGDRATSELAAKFQVHPTQVPQWKRELAEQAEQVFGRDRDRESREQEALAADLYERIIRLQMELEWMKKSTRQRLVHRFPFGVLYRIDLDRSTFRRWGTCIASRSTGDAVCAAPSERRVSCGTWPRTPAAVLASCSPIPGR